MSGNTPVKEGATGLVQMRGLSLPCKASRGSRRLEIFFEAFNHAWSHEAEGMVQGYPGHYINASNGLNVSVLDRRDHIGRVFLRGPARLSRVVHGHTVILTRPIMDALAQHQSRESSRILPHLSGYEKAQDLKGLM
ncbi:hypothetical protein M405DRAFT_865425 [Rhizopogon salebrosus TDB-379]|nr:hypothetical protein M405DRAFT_865425 [Rhizopogon salebrosus TDB-379]